MCVNIIYWTERKKKPRPKDKCPFASNHYYRPYSLMYHFQYFSRNGELLTTPSKDLECLRFDYRGLTVALNITIYHVAISYIKTNINLPA